MSPFTYDDPSLVPGGTHFSRIVACPNLIPQVELRRPSMFRRAKIGRIRAKNDRIAATLNTEFFCPRIPMTRRVFFSSTGRDLSDYRAAATDVCNELGLIPIAMEFWESMGRGATAISLAKLDTCDVFVGFFAHRYGHVEDGDDRSVTEREFDHAAKMDRICFVMSQEHPWPMGKIEVRQLVQQEAFKERVGKLAPLPFGTIDDFKHKVYMSLSEWVKGQSSTSEEQTTPSPARSAELRGYLGQLAENFRWLELQGIREARTLRIELEKVYVALKAEPESEYDLQQAANLHTVEVREAAGVESLDMIDPKHLEDCDAANIRRTYRPGKEEAKRATVTEVRTVGDAFRQHRRMVILGGPGSGKTTLGRWLALQLARGLLRRLDSEVVSEDRAATPTDIRIVVPENTTFAFSGKHFLVPNSTSDESQEVRIETLPTRGALKLAGVAVTAGQVIDLKQINLLTYIPVANESGTGYAHFRFATGNGVVFRASAATVVDVRVHIRVPVSQIDPDPRVSRAPDELVDLGPARLPIFLRLAHFAREVAEREGARRPTLSLIDYLGLDPDSCSLADGCTPESRNALFRSYLNARQAVVILDGLDELPEANRRSVVLKIQDFIEKPTQTAAQTETAAPWEVGGNQVVVTSRYVGYKFAPVRAGSVHFGIQSMQRPAVERFAHSWTTAVNVELAAEKLDRVVAENLIAEIYNEARPAVRELATNPLLVTILATVYWADGRLPDQRAGVYDRVVENLLRIWLQREECRRHLLTREELLAALEPLAAEMQANASSNGLIDLARIGELVQGPLADLRGMDPTDRAFRPIKEALLETIRKHVGLLAEQSKGNYAFFHRTFQEFLAARHLLANRQKASEKISGRLDDPLWREPLLLALGFAMIDPEWGPEARSQLLSEVLAADGPDALIPRAALLLVTALPDLRDAPAGVVGQTAVRLLTSYAKNQDQTHADVLREQIEQAFVRLREGRQTHTVARQVGESIRRPTDGRDLAGAAAMILRRIDWFTTEMVESLLQAVHRDRADLDWPIHRALLAALGYRPAAFAWLGPAPALNMGRILSTHLPMRKLLEMSPDLVTLIQSDTDWLWLLVALYGGLGNVQLLEKLERYQLQRLQLVQTASATVSVEERAADLRPPIPAIEFSPHDIVHDLGDADLSRLIQRHLSARKPARELTEVFQQRWSQGSNPAGSAEALVGLASLGEDVLSMLRAALTQTTRQVAARAALARFGWLRTLLQEPLVRASEAAARTIPEDVPEHHQLDLLRIALGARNASGGSPLEVSDKIPECRYVAAATPEVRDSLEAEYWSYLFSGTTADDRNEGAVFGAIGNRITWSPDCLIRSWSVLSEARNHKATRRLPWPQAILAPQADSPVERYLAMLDSMTSVPREYDLIAGYVLGRCWSFLEEHPALAWETLALCFCHGDAFLRGYLSAVVGFALNSASPSSFSVQEMPEPIQMRLRRLRESKWDDASEHQRLAAQILACAMPLEPTNDNSTLVSRRALCMHASRIANPYLRFRAQWRLLGTVTEEDDAVEMDILGLVEQIASPHDQVRAFEWIMMTIPATDIDLVNHIGLLDPMVQTLSRIADPENRARAQCRLAFFASERLESLLRDAVESVGMIADAKRKSETISEVRAAWGRTPGISDALDAVAHTLPDAWQRDKALGLASRLVQAYRRHYSTGALVWRFSPDQTPTSKCYRCLRPTGSLPWGLLYLNATAAELESHDATRTGGDAHWNRLLGMERQAGIAALVAAGVEGGLQVTAREASILDRVVQSGRAADLDCLWPFLERPEPGAMGTATRWSGRPDGAGGWSALVQAEAGRLTPEVVTTVIDLLADSTDRLHLRAALALHGRAPNNRNRQRRWSVRRVGAQAVDVVARCATQIDHSPAVRSSLWWVHHDIHHDDPEALEHWLTQAAAAESAREPACWILDSLESIHEDLVPPLTEALKSAVPRVQQILLLSLARLAHCSETLEKSVAAVRAAIASVPPEVRAGVCVLPKGPITYLEIAKQAVAASGNRDHLDQARQMLEPQMLWLDESSLSNDKGFLERLKAIGDQLYINIGSYWSATDKAAVPLKENAAVLQLLLRWLESEGVTATADHVASHLLTATEALARLSPEAFAVLADPDLWEPTLTEWVVLGGRWTARMAAVRLLGRLRRVTNRVVMALKAALNDVSFVQQAAYASVSEFRHIEGDILPELIRVLEDPSASVAAATARLLVGVARAEGTSADRCRIRKGLEQAATRTSMTRPVYLMDQGNWGMAIRFVDRLDRILYRAIFDVSGL
jgi:Domain of unknown function (DUF4062)